MIVYKSEKHFTSCKTVTSSVSFLTVWNL